MEIIVKSLIKVALFMGMLGSQYIYLRAAEESVIDEQRIYERIKQILEATRESSELIKEINTRYPTAAPANSSVILPINHANIFSAACCPFAQNV